MSNVIDFKTGEIIEDPTKDQVMDALMSAIYLLKEKYVPKGTQVPLNEEK